MPYYRRAVVAGATFFVTIVTGRREPLFGGEAARARLRWAIGRCPGARPFEVDAIVLLPGSARPSLAAASRRFLSP
ncbi:MAG TPA: hypothetical protein VGN72_14145 [Tepidisphaeraceae bacterium]|nr:hypothetical protein [Tepidisphaeraceae bacterium]